MTGVEDLLRVLEEERSRLIGGDLSALPDLSARKLAAIEGTDGTAVPPEALARVHAAASRNAVLLEAAARGIRAALQGISAARSAAMTETYDEKGRRRRMASPAADHERRA